MTRPDAASVKAEMVNLKPVRDWANKQRIDKTMGLDTLSFDVENAIAAVIKVAGVKPAFAKNGIKNRAAIAECMNET